MENAYWCGRFSSLRDRFRNEGLEDEEFVEGKDKDTRDLERLEMLRKGIDDGDDMDSGEDGGLEDSWTRDEERRAKRCFTHLDALCSTAEAKASLKVRHPS